MRGKPGLCLILVVVASPICSNFGTRAWASALRRRRSSKRSAARGALLKAVISRVAGHGSPRAVTDLRDQARMLECLPCVEPMPTVAISPLRRRLIEDNDDPAVLG